MDFVVLLNYLRFLAMTVSVFFIFSPEVFIILALTSTVLYSLIAPMVRQSYAGVGMDKSISHVPSSILLAVLSYYDEDLRPIFLMAGGVQYINIWLQMYAEIFTKELRTQISAKKGLGIVEELLWALSDSYVLMSLMMSFGVIKDGEMIKPVYHFALSGFITRKVADLYMLGSNVLSIVDLEPKKSN